MGRAGKFAKIFIDGGEVTTYTSDVTISTTFDEIEKSAYGQDKRYILGQGDSKLTFDGYMSDVSVAALAAGAKQVTVVLGNNAAPATGDPSFSLAGVQSEIIATPAKDGIQAVSAKFAAQNSGSWGVMLANQTVTEDGNGTTVDQAAATTAGGVGYLHIYGGSTSDTVQVAIQDSADNSSWDDLGVFTLDASAVGAQRLEIAGAVAQYVRAEWDVTGSGISISFAVFFQRL